MAKLLGEVMDKNNRNEKGKGRGGREWQGRRGGGGGGGIRQQNRHDSPRPRKEENH